jgi:hypothetical protein
MVCRYKEICGNFNCEAKVFTQMPGNLRNQIGTPELIILFTNTVSHKMVLCAVQEAAKRDIPIARVHSSSSCALKNVMATYYEAVG